MIPKHCLVLALSVVIASLAAATPVDAQPPAPVRARQLLRRANQAYFRMRMDEAERHVLDAVAICEREGCPGSDRATLYLALGCIAHTASGDDLRARMAFDRALELDADAELDPDLVTPEVRTVFGAARAARQTPPPASAEEPPRAPPAPAWSHGDAPDAAHVPLRDDEADEAPGLAHEADAAEGRGPRRRIVFFELGYSLTGASASGDLRVATPPDAGFGEDLQLDQRLDNDSYVLAGTDGCDAPANTYCVRVSDGLVTFAHGLHLGLGAYVTEHFGLAARVRLAPVSGGGTLSRVVLGGRLYYRPIAPLPEGFHFAVFVGSMVGQIQVRPRQEPTEPGAPIARPWGRTGLYGAEIGLPFGHRFTPGFGVFVAPEAYVLAPSFSFGLQATLGLDVTFGEARR